MILPGVDGKLNQQKNPVGVGETYGVRRKKHFVTLLRSSDNSSSL